MSEYFITGPGGATNNSMKKEAKNLIKGTVSKSYFKSTWKKRNQKQNYAAWNENGKMSGFALLKKKGDMLELSLIGTRPGKGIGKLIFEQIKENAENSGITKIRLDSVPDAFGFYSKLGFKLIEFNDEHIIMNLNLAQSRSPSPNRKKSPSPIPNKKSPSPKKLQSPVKKSPSPIPNKKSPSPVKKSPSPIPKKRRSTRVRTVPARLR